MRSPLSSSPRQAPVASSLTSFVDEPPNTIDIDSPLAHQHRSPLACGGSMSLHARYHPPRSPSPDSSQPSPIIDACDEVDRVRPSTDPEEYDSARLGAGPPSEGGV